MSVWLIILIIVIILSGYILFFPVTVKIDTDDSRYFIRLPGIFSFRLLQGKSGWKMRFSVLFLRFNVPLFQPGEHKKKLKEKPLKKRKSFSGRRFKPGYLLLGINIIKTFRLKSLRWSVDTGDYPLNAQLIPVVTRLNEQKHIRMSVNFNDYNSFHIILRTHLFRIVYVTIRYFMFNR